MTGTTRQKAKILVADDDPIVLELTAAILMRLGYDVLTAPDGEAALKTFEASPRAIQLVIADAVMPGLGGRELLRTITNLSPSTPTLLMSGSPEIVLDPTAAAL